MRESYRKGVAIHPDPESCVVAREGAIEALTGAPAGRVLSCEIIATGVPTLFSRAEGHTPAGATASPMRDSAQSETPGMQGNSTRENRETPSTPGETWPGRLEKAVSRTSSTRGGGESDGRVVPTNGPNGAALRTRRGRREGGRPRRTPSRRPRPGHRAGTASRAACAVCESRHGRGSGCGSPRYSIM